MRNTVQQQESVIQASPRSLGTELQNIMDSFDAEGSQANIPVDVVQWNNYLKQQNFDPFDKVLLVKGIDNSILTSCRTLKGENNTVSDTFKIVHKKFLPQKNPNHRFYKQMMAKLLEKMPYNINEEANESVIEFDFIEEYPTEDIDVKNVNDTKDLVSRNNDGVKNDDGTGT